MIAVCVTFTIKEESIHDFHTAVVAQANNSLNNEEACRQFDVHTDPKNPARFFLYETYDSHEAFAAHQQTPHFADFSSKAKDMVAQKELLVYEVVPR